MHTDMAILFPHIPVVIKALLQAANKFSESTRVLGIDTRGISEPDLPAKLRDRGRDALLGGVNLVLEMRDEFALGEESHMYAEYVGSRQLIDPSKRLALSSRIAKQCLCIKNQVEHPQVPLWTWHSGRTLPS